ncbi:Trithorax group protein like [Quillaja saponaria]|uniref:Trithorax group protein like n=1 Tax=Quillaja saponaria TaxID=32244 RepID=A0AAD7LZL9_QUISA|nr:Trithorax group protein like [Quillaja saponaria]KAJ7967209.1 Trithorax group protein like [Quillaja saponaria]
MGYCCRPKPTSNYGPNLLLILAVILILIGIPWLFKSEPVVVAVEEKKGMINWPILAIPILLLLIVLWLSSMGTSKRGCVPLPPPPCCRCKMMCYCYPR